MEQVRTLKARVLNGRLVLDEPTELPDGTELELVPVGDFDDVTLDPAQLDELRRSWEGARVPMADLLDRLRR